jgi:hypothetical protein
MKKNTIFTAFFCIMALLFVTVLGSCRTVQEQSKQTNPTVGVWRIVQPALDTTTIANQKKVKIITEGHFIWTHTVDNVIVISMGGTCTFDGKMYTEEVQYRSPNMRNSIGEKAVYDVKFEDGKMHCVGTFGKEGVINEIWERVE